MLDILVLDFEGILVLVHRVLVLDFVLDILVLDFEGILVLAVWDLLADILYRVLLVVKRVCPTGHLVAGHQESEAPQMIAAVVVQE